MKIRNSNSSYGRKWWHGNYTAEVVRDIMEEYFGMNTQTVEEDMSAKPYIQNNELIKRFMGILYKTQIYI